MGKKFQDKYQKHLRPGYYVQESVAVVNPRFRKYLNLGEETENVFYFTGNFDKKNGKPLFTSCSGSKEFTESYNQNFCGLLRAVDESEIEFVKEPDFIDRVLDWISSFA